MLLKSIYDCWNTLVCLIRTKYHRKNKITPNVRNIRTSNEFYKNEEIEESTMEHETDTTMASVSARASKNLAIFRKFQLRRPTIQFYASC